MIYDKDLLTGQIEASRNITKNLDNECKDLLKENNQLRKIAYDLANAGCHFQNCESDSDSPSWDMFIALTSYNNFLKSKVKQKYE